MDCNTFKSALDDYLDGELDSETAGRIEAHMAACAACAAEADRARALRRALADYPVSPIREAFVDRALQRATSRRSMAAGRVVAIGFVATLMLSVVTVILTGLSVQAPRTQISAALPTVSMRLDEPRIVNLVFDTRIPLDDVTLLVTVPRGIEIEGYAGQSQVEWRTSLEPGKNLLPLGLVAHEGSGGQLVAQLGHGDSRKIFRVHLDLGAG